MANWNEIRSDVTKVASKAIKKTGELADTASVHLKIKMAEVRLSAAFEKLGKLTYKQLKTEVSQAEAISETMATIDTLRADVKTLKIRLEEMKEAKKNDDFEKDSCDTHENC